MLKLPEKYRDLEILIRRVLLFGLGVTLLVIYISPILGIIGTAIEICMPFIIGGALAFVLNTLANVLMNWAKRFLHWKTEGKWTILYKVLTLVIIFSIIGIFLAILVPQIISSIEKITTELPQAMNDLYQSLLHNFKEIPIIYDLLEKNKNLFLDFSSLVGKIGDFLTIGTAGGSMDTLKSIISNTFSWLWIFFLSIVFSIIVFFNTNQFKREGNLLAKAYMSKSIYEKTKNILNLMSRTFSQYIGGTVLECLILSSLVMVGCLIFQIPDAALIGLIIGIFALVPMFGATVGAIICALFTAIVSPIKGITFFIMFVVIQQIEGNFIYPNVVGKSVGLPAPYVVVAITIGASLAGILGMVVSIPVASVVYALVTDQAQKRVDWKEEIEKENAELELQDMQARQNGKYKSLLSIHMINSLKNLAHLKGNDSSEFKSSAKDSADNVPVAQEKLVQKKEEQEQELVNKKKTSGQDQ